MLDFNLEVRQVTNGACICPSGFFGARCETLNYAKCFVNITDPAVYDTTACRNGMADGDSIEGFDSCFFFDFSKTYTFKFRLSCKSVTAKGLVPIDTH
jgi:hypothetical protein